MKGVEIEMGAYGSRAILRDQWNPMIQDYLIQSQIAELVLIDGKGWHGVDIDFLRNLTFLKAFVLIDMSIATVQGVMSLENLEFLKLVTYSRTPINFRCFPRLRHCSFEWVNKSESLFKSHRLKSLSINRYPGVDLEALTQLSALERLSVFGSRTAALKGIERLTKLTHLQLANLKHLTSLEGLRSLGLLEELEVQACRSITSIDEVANLKRLQRLLLLDNGSIKSLSSLGGLANLREVLFYGSTNISDGDLSPLKELQLTNVSFQNRRHYNMRREDFGDAFFGKNR